MARGLSSFEGAHHPKAHIDGAFKKLANVVATAPIPSRTAQDSVAKSHQVALRKAIYREAREILGRKREDSGGKTTRYRPHDRRWKLKDICDAVFSATKITLRTYRIVDWWKEAVRDTRASKDSVRPAKPTPATSPRAPTPQLVEQALPDISPPLDEKSAPAEMLQMCMDAVFAELHKTGGVWNGKTESVVQLCQNIGSALSHLTHMCTSDLDLISGVGSLLSSTSANLATMLRNLKNEMSKIQSVLKGAEDARVAAEAEAGARAEAAKVQSQMQADRFAARRAKRRAADAQREEEAQREQEEARQEEMRAAGVVASKPVDTDFALRQTILVIEQLELLEKQLSKNIAENGCNNPSSSKPEDSAVSQPRSIASMQTVDRDEKSHCDTRTTNSVVQSAKHDVGVVDVEPAPQQQKQKAVAQVLPCDGRDLRPIAAEPTKIPQDQSHPISYSMAALGIKAEQSKPIDVTNGTSVAKVATPARTMQPSEGHRASPAPSSYQQLYSAAAQVFEKTMSTTRNISTTQAANAGQTSIQESLDVLVQSGPCKSVLSSKTDLLSNAQVTAAPLATVGALPIAGNSLAAKGWHRIKPPSSTVEATPETTAFSSWPSIGESGSSSVEDTWHNRHLFSGRSSVTAPSSASHVFSGVESGNPSSSGGIYQTIARRPSQLAEMPHLRMPLTARESVAMPPLDDPLSARGSRSTIMASEMPRSALMQRRPSQEAEMRPRIEKRVRFCAPQSATHQSAPPEPQSPQSPSYRLPPLAGATAALGLLGRASEKGVSSSSPMTAWQNFMAAGSNFV